MYVCIKLFMRKKGGWGLIKGGRDEMQYVNKVGVGKDGW